MSDVPIDDVLEVVGGPGSLSDEQIVAELVAEYGHDERAAKVALADAIAGGDVVDHPDFDGCYVLG